MEARPLALELCRAWTAETAETADVDALQMMASAAGYLGVIDLKTAEAGAGE